MAHPPGHLASNPLPNGISGALGLRGYQLLAEVGGVGVGRLGPQVFLLVAPDEEPGVTDPGTQLALHQSKLREEAEITRWTGLAAQLGYLRLSGYRLVLEREGMRTAVGVLNPATGGVAARIPSSHPGRLAGRGFSVGRLLAELQALPAAGAPPALEDPELLRQVFLALALREESIGGAEAADVADRALEIALAHPELDPPAALLAARNAQLGT
jgi:hypothetical protein